MILVSKMGGLSNNNPQLFTGYSLPAYSQEDKLMDEYIYTNRERAANEGVKR